MAKTRRAIINTIIQGCGQVVSWTLTWCLLIMLPRALGAVGFGELFYAISYGTIFSTLINLGINTYLTKQVAVLCPQPGHSPEEIIERNGKLRALLGNTVSLKILLASGVYLVQSVVIFLWTDDETLRQAVLIIGLGTCFAGITPMFSGTFRGRERMAVPTLAVIAEKLLVSGACAVLLWYGCGLISVCWVHCAGAFLQLGIQSVCLSRIQPFCPSWDRRLLRQIIVGGLPFLVSVVFSEIYIRIDVIMLEHLASKAVVGWYGTAFRVYATLFFLPTILLNSVSPVIMRMGANNEPISFGRANERLMNLLIFAAIPVGFGTIAISAPLVTVLYGKSYADAIPILMIFGFSIPLVCIDMILGTALIAKDKEKEWATMAVLAAFFNPIANYWLIPYTSARWGNGAIGAAFATAMTELLMMAGALWLMPAGIFTRSNIMTAVKAGVIGGGMVVLLRLWGNQNLLFLIPAGAAIYLPFAFLLRVPPREDVLHMVHAFKSLLERKQATNAESPSRRTAKWSLRK